MTRALSHRGPDDEGYVSIGARLAEAHAYGGPSTPAELQLPPLPPKFIPGTDLALGHRRLAILDLSPAGHGPMASADGRLWLAYNGEVYNYVELRAELSALGHRFRTHTDTEVLLAAYAQWGRDMLPRLNGMWAFALYDVRQRLLFCARDRFGVKPFHYVKNGSFFAFASEIKGLLAHPRVPRRPHEPTLAGFLFHGQLDEAEQTFFEGVLSLAPSHALAFDLRTERLSTWRWYDVPEVESRPADVNAFRALLEDAVRLRLRSDVDVGTCLSGGLDSSSIVALTTRLHDSTAGSRRRSFSIVYSDEGLDESKHVETVAAATGVDAQVVSATAHDLLNDLPALVRAQDEPSHRPVHTPIGASCPSRTRQV